MAEMKMTRRVTFSSGHRYWLPQLSREENVALFGTWASPFNHGHNYILWVTVNGKVDTETGMLVNIKRVDDALKKHVVKLLNQKSINDEVDAFISRPSTLENLLQWLYEVLSGPGVLPFEVGLTDLKLEETETFYGELTYVSNQPLLSITRVYEFAAAHRLHAQDLSQAENDRLYGKCNNPAGHGHNYVLEVTVSGQPDPNSGMLADLEQLDGQVNELVVDRYDHKNLNEDLPEFNGRITTSEIVAAEIFQRLEGKLPAKLHRIRLFETARNVFEISAAP